MQNLSETNINMQKEAQTEQGRSMVETLGVLAIIGVLAIGGIMGYKWAMDKYVANQIANEIRIADLDIATSLMTKNDGGITLALEKPFGDNKLSIADTPFDYGCTAEATLDKECVAGEENYHMTLGNISKGVCQKLLEMTPYTQYYVRQLVGDTETVEGEACQEEMNDIVIFYNIETGYGAAGNSDEVDECPPETPLYNEETGECRLANSAFQIITIDKEDGTTAKLYVSNDDMNWWSAQRFCNALGKRMIAISDLGCADPISLPVYDNYCHGTPEGDDTIFEPYNVSNIIEQISSTVDYFYLANMNDGSCDGIEVWSGYNDEYIGNVYNYERNGYSSAVCVDETLGLNGSMTENAGHCPTNVPNWDAETGACTNGCDDINAPSFNVTTGECEACPGSQQWDMQRHACVCESNADCPGDKPYCGLSCMKCPYWMPVWNPNGENGPDCYECPEETPEYNKETGECVACPDDKPAFNYYTMKCEACPEGMDWYDDVQECYCAYETPMWNDETEKCEACPADTPAFNMDDWDCEACPDDTPAWNASTRQCESCPTDKPSWNASTRQCEACPEDTPVWNASTRQCESCPTDKPVWNADTKQCEESPCEEGYVYGYRKYASGGRDSEKACWPCGYVYHDKPYWNGSQCIACPSGMSRDEDYTYGSSYDSVGYTCWDSCRWNNDTFYNEETGECEACPDNKPKWNSSIRRCEEADCPEGYVYGYRQVSWATQDSEKACWPCGYVYRDKPYWNGSQCTTCPSDMKEVMDETYGSYGSGKYGYKCVRRCGDNAPVWNATNRKCEACPSDSPVWNATNRQCEACPDNKPKWNSSTKQCEEANCPEGFVYGYRQVSWGPQDSEKACWPCGYVDHDKPYWNGSQCTTCPVNMIKISVGTHGSDGDGKPGYACEIYCEDDDAPVFNNWTCNACPDNTPKWNASMRQCEACPDDKPKWNASTKQCEEA